jgi:hypothetical protein
MNSTLPQTESQVFALFPRIADFTVDGTLPVEEIAHVIIEKFDLQRLGNILAN